MMMMVVVVCRRVLLRRRCYLKVPQECLLLLLEEGSLGALRDRHVVTVAGGYVDTTHWQVAHVAHGDVGGYCLMVGRYSTGEEGRRVV